MRCFDYPFDPAFILQKKRALRRELLASEGLVPKKVAILSGSTVGEIKNILELFLLNAGIRPEFYVGGYALFYEELTFDADGALAAFAPDIIYVLGAQFGQSAAADGHTRTGGRKIRRGMRPLAGHVEGGGPLRLPGRPEQF